MEMMRTALGVITWGDSATYQPRDEFDRRAITFVCECAAPLSDAGLWVFVESYRGMKQVVFGWTREVSDGLPTDEADHVASFIGLVGEYLHHGDPIMRTGRPKFISTAYQGRWDAKAKE